MRRKLIRIANGYTLEELAKLLGCDKAYLHRYEKGRITGKTELQKKIDKWYNEHDNIIVYCED